MLRIDIFNPRLWARSTYTPWPSYSKARHNYPSLSQVCSGCLVTDFTVLPSNTPFSRRATVYDWVVYSLRNPLHWRVPSLPLISESLSGPPLSKRHLDTCPVAAPKRIIIRHLGSPDLELDSGRPRSVVLLFKV